MSTGYGKKKCNLRLPSPLSYHLYFIDHFFLNEKLCNFGHTSSSVHGFFPGSHSVSLVSVFVSGLLTHEFNEYSFINVWIAGKKITYFRSVFVTLSPFVSIRNLEIFYFNFFKYFAGSLIKILLKLSINFQRNNTLKIVI